MLKKALIILGSLFLLLAIGIGGFCLYLTIGKDSVLHEKIKDVDLKQINDGDYIGSYNGYRWSNSVEVKIENHMYKSIKMLKLPTFAKDEQMDSMIQNVLYKQSLKVDCVSGATVTSKAFLKAVENAIDKKNKGE